MTIYVDLVFILNFAFDFLLMLVTSLTLKVNIKIRYLILSSLFGSLSLIFLFIKLSNLELFLVKVVISIIMILISFPLKDFFKAIKNLYIVSIVLGGFLYFLSLTFSYKNEGLIFYYDKFNINFIVLLIISPISLYIYIRNIKENKETYNDLYLVKLIFKNKSELKLRAFLDTGNKLVDPYFNKPIIIINKKVLNNNIPKDLIYVPYNGLNNNGILKCFKIDRLIIKNEGIFNNLLVGIAEEEIKIGNADLLLNKKIWEEKKNDYKKDKTIFSFKKIKEK